MKVWTRKRNDGHGVPLRGACRPRRLCSCVEGQLADLNHLQVNFSQLEQTLLEPESGLFESLINSVLGVDNTKGGICGLSAASKSKMFTFTIDSGSTVHILTLEAAQQLLHSKEPSRLQVVGVSGKFT